MQHIDGEVWRPKDLFVEPATQETVAMRLLEKMDARLLYWKIIAYCGWICAATLAIWRMA